MKYIQFEKVVQKNHHIKLLIFVFELISVAATCVALLVYSFGFDKVLRTEKPIEFQNALLEKPAEETPPNCSVIIPNQEISKNCEIFEEYSKLNQLDNISGYCKNSSGHCPLCSNTTSLTLSDRKKLLLFDLNCISKYLTQQPWIGNLTNVRNFRHDLGDHGVNSREELLITKENANNLSAVGGLNRNKIISANRYLTSLPNYIYQFLPKESPFSLSKRGYFSRCSVVGSSSMLLYSKCGEDIDKSSFVFRCNAPPIKPFAVDAGSKSTLTTLNINSVVEKRYKGAMTREHKKKFFDDMQQYGRGWAWLSAQGATNLRAPALRAFSTLNIWRNWSKVKAILAHPRHHKTVNDFWKTRLYPEQNKTESKFISTGLYMTSVALTMCNETHLYGFWPFDRGGDGEKTLYHYYDELEMSGRHAFYKEFIYLFELHKKGVIKLHYGKCKNKSYY